ncbi:MAG: magnesium/cobalt transporter CorA [Acidobacteriota bacterium]
MQQLSVLDGRSKWINSEFPVAEISDLLTMDDVVIWLDLENPTDADWTLLKEEFNFHPLAIEDCQNAHQRSKIELYNGYFFIVMYEIVIVDDLEMKMQELHLFLGNDYVVTIHQGAVPSLQAARKQWLDAEESFTTGASFLAYLIIDSIVDGYFPIIDRYSERLEELEEEVFSKPQVGMMESVFRVRKQLLFLRRAVAPLRDVMNVMLRRDTHIIAPQTYPYYQDIFDHLVRIGDAIDTHRELATGVTEAYLSVAGHRMNEIMKRLTVISTVLMTGALIAGIYGMNFQVMPELQWRWGYPMALGMIISIAIILYFYFRKIDWL